MMKKLKLLGNDEGKLLKRSLDIKEFGFQLLENNDAYVLNESDIIKCIIVSDNNEVVFNEEVQAVDRAKGIISLKLDEDNYIEPGIYEIEFCVVNTNKHDTFGEEEDYAIIVKRNLFDLPSSDVSEQVKSEYAIIIAQINQVDSKLENFKVSQLAVNGQLQTNIDNLSTLHANDKAELLNMISNLELSINNTLATKLDKSVFDSNKVETDNTIAANKSDADSKIAQLENDKANKSDFTYVESYEQIKQIWDKY